MRVQLAAAMLVLALPAMAQTATPPKAANPEQFEKLTYDFTTPLRDSAGDLLMDGTGRKDPKDDPDCERRDTGCRPLTMGQIVYNAELSRPAPSEMALAPQMLGDLVQWRGALATRLRTNKAGALAPDELADIELNVARNFSGLPLVLFQVYDFLNRGVAPAHNPAEIVASVAPTPPAASPATAKP
jgi:hypothetical protein